MKLQSMFAIAGLVGVLALLAVTQTAHAATPSRWAPPCASASSLPEPAAWSMMILGVGAIGAVLRRRRALEA